MARYKEWKARSKYPKRAIFDAREDDDATTITPSAYNVTFATHLATVRNELDAVKAEGDGVRLQLTASGGVTRPIGTRNGIPLRWEETRQKSGR